MSALRKIAEDLFQGLLPQGAEVELAKARLNECERCPSFKRVARMCSECHCFMDVKVKITNAECPLGKW